MINLRNGEIRLNCILNRKGKNLWERKIARVVVMLSLAGAVCLWDNSLYLPSRMPDIVFIIPTFFPEGCREIFFIDNNGDCYYSDDPYVCDLQINTEGQGDHLIAEYATGSLKDKIILCGKCDMKELYSNYKKLYQVSRNRKLRLESPMTIGDFANGKDRQWCGIYYDKREEMQLLDFRRSFNGVTYKANDERANAIYNWCKKIINEIRQKGEYPEDLLPSLRSLEKS